MSQTSEFTHACPICSEQRTQHIELPQEWPISRFECERCGTYKMRRDLSVQTEKPWQKVGHLVSAWIRRENKTKIVPRVGKDANKEELASPDWWFNKFSHMGFPQTVNEKLDTLLLTYTEIVDGNLQGNIFPIAPRVISEIAAKNIEEVIGLTTMLGELGYVHSVLSAESPPCSYISAKGWLHIDELHKATSTSDSVFVAMWFDDITKKYREVVIAAIEYCGYKPIVRSEERRVGKECRL